MYDLNLAGPQRPVDVNHDRWNTAVTGGEGFVPTEVAKAAALDREGELLAAIGIPENGTHHCPLRRGHKDNNPSFRWDKARKRAYCSCIPSWHTKGHKSLDIFGLVAEMRGITFAEAKIWAMRCLGRTDLIKTQGKEKKDRVAEALNPPPELRDDLIPPAYLRGRLGGAEIPKPTTPVIGWKKLGYYDAPIEGKKAQKVGDWPCAVFGLTDIDGHIHAHRIYTNGAGGKADLPPLANGEARPVKKLIYDGGNSSGLCVVWGNLLTATLIIIAEGIETAAAIATSFSADLGDNLAVVAGISAGGIEAFRPGPNCTAVIVAADRDDLKTKRGEQAARVFCTKHHGRIRVVYAMPGQPGTNCDWLDVLVAHGSQAVKDGILAAQDFVPEPTDSKNLPAVRFSRMIQVAADGETIVPVQQNAFALLAPVIGAHLAFDQFRNKLVWRDDGNPPWPWHAKADKYGYRDLDKSFYTGAMLWLQSQTCMIRARWMVRDAIEAICDENRFDSLIDYLDKCKAAEHKPQICAIDTFLIVVMGVAEYGDLQNQFDEKTGKWKFPLSDADKRYAELHSRYVRAQSRNYFMRAVKRARHPGAKCDEILNVQGEEGTRKSTVVKKLYEPSFSDHLPRNLDSKDTDQILASGIWHFEIGDGTHLSRTNAADFKNWASREADNYRAPYDFEPAMHPRRCTFTITSNEYENLMSLTGNRRLPTVESRWCKPELITEELRAALFAEADQALERGEPYWLDDNELIGFAAELVSDKVQEAPYTQLVISRLDKARFYKLDEIMGALGLGADPARWSSLHRSVTDSLKQAGWRTKPMRLFGHDKTQRRWVHKSRLDVTGVTSE